MMNPIIDIVAKVANPETQAPAAAPAKGDGQNLFGQVFAQAVAATSEPVATPAIVAENGPSNSGDVSPQDASLTAQLLQAIVDPAATGIVVPMASEGQITESGVAAIGSASSETAVEVVSDNLSKPIQTGKAVAIPTTSTQAAVNQLLTASANPTVPSAENVLGEQVKNLVAEALSANTKQESAPVTINTQVEISSEALDAIAKAKAAPVAETAIADGTPIEENVRLSVPTAVGLKAQMRKSFTTADIKSVSAKATVEVKLSDSQIKNNIPTDTQVTAQNNVKAVDLPIASARQIAMATVNPGMVRRSQRSERVSTTNVKEVSNLSSRQTNGEKIATRATSNSGMRKPVQIALKSQGFDLDALAASTARGESTLQSANLEKMESLSALDKPAAVAVDRTLDLNGIERFKLEIKRGHIEALLKKGEIKLQLQPDHLGSLKVKLITSPNNVSARLETSSEDARRAVEASLPQLREGFERAGLKLSSIEVVVNHDNDQRRQQAFHQDAHGRNGGARRSLREFGQDIPVALTEIANTQLSAYGGALNLVA